MAFINGPVPETLERELAASVAAFERDLRKAWPGEVASPLPGHFRIDAGDVVLDIHAEPAGVRRIGLLALDLVRVRYRFSAGDEAARRRLLARLDLGMQRGGG